MLPSKSHQITCRRLRRRPNQYNAGSDRAVTLLNRILKSRPDDPTSHAMLAALSFKRHDCKAAVAHFRASSDLISSQRSALDQYGFCLVSLDRAKDAVPIYQRVLSSAMEDPQARLHLAAAQSLADQPQDAIATLQPVLAEGNPRPEVCRWRRRHTKRRVTLLEPWSFFARLS